MIRKVYRAIRKSSKLLHLSNFFKKVRKFFIKNVYHKPQFIQLELNNVCNLRCKMCATQNFKVNPKNMSFSLYRKVINQIVEMNIPILKLFWFNEPLLNPELEKAITYAKNKGIKYVTVVTNATLLSEERAKKILDTPLDKLTYSIEGINKEQYESVRTGSNFEKVLENVKRFKELRDKRNQKKPIISIQSIMDIKNCCNDKEKFRNFWKLHVDEIDFNKLVIPPELKKMKINPPKPFDKSECGNPWTNLTILPEGKVTLCCDPENKMKLGDVNKQTLEEIWNGEKLKEIRDCIENGNYNQVKACRECDRWS